MKYQKFRTLLAVLAGAVMLLGLSPCAFAAAYQTIEGYTAPEGVEVTTVGPYGWSCYNGSQTLISGNANQASSVSSLKVTVTGPGVLSFRYEVYAPTALEENNPDSLFITAYELTPNMTNSAIEGQRYYGETDWQSGTVVVEAEEGVTTDIYFSYKKNGSVNHKTDAALLKDLVFSSGYTQVSAVSGNEIYGTVSGGQRYCAGEEVTLTAQAAPGGRFFGWIRDGQFLPAETGNSYSFTAGADTEVTAIFGSAENTLAQNRRSGAVYESLSTALAQADAGDRIVPVRDFTLEEDAAVPAGVTLYVPFSAEPDSSGCEDGTSANRSDCFAGESETYRHLTVAEGVTLDVQGTLRLGGVISYPGTSYNGHTSGAHGRITNNGRISVSLGAGCIECYGFIDGSGTLEALYGKVFEPFVVYDFAGGNNTERLYSRGQNPFMQYTTQNISCTLVIHSGAQHGAYCNLYAGSQYNKTNAVLIRSHDNNVNAVLILNEGATVTRTVDKTRSVPGGTGAGNYGADIYRTTYTVSGGAELGNMQMLIYGFDVSVSRMPVSYANSYVLTDGSYVMNKNWCILPGGELKAENGADLTVNGQLYALDGLINSGMSGRFYPSSEKLADNGFATNGVLTVNGSLRLGSGASFGGIVQTERAGATVLSDIHATLTEAALQIGAQGYYDDNTCVMPLNARVRIGDELIQMTPGSLYTAESATAWTLPGYTVTEYASSEVSSSKPDSGKYTERKNADGNITGYTVYAGPVTVTTDQPMKGTFLKGGVSEGFILVNETYYSEDDATRTTISTPVQADGDATFTVSRTAAGQSYNFLVEYSIDGGPAVRLTPDRDGVYLIRNVTGKITVRVISVMKGDVSLNGAIAANDVTLIRRVLAGYESFSSEFAELAADCSSNGAVAANDVTLLRRFLAGYTDSL